MCCRRSCEVSTLHLENCANARRIHVFLVINPLFLTSMEEMVETSTLPRPVPKSHRRSCEVSTLHLENCASSNSRLTLYFSYGWNVKFHRLCESWKLCCAFFGWLTPMHGSRISTFFVNVPVITLPCANARRIHVFLVINPLFLTSMGEMVETSTLTVPKSHRRSCEVSTLHPENCANARLTFFGWPIFLTPVGKR